MKQVVLYRFYFSRPCYLSSIDSLCNFFLEIEQFSRAKSEVRSDTGLRHKDCECEHVWQQESLIHA